MATILMTPEQIPSRFSMAEDAEPAAALRQAGRPRLTARLAASAARLQRVLSAPPGGRGQSSAAAW